MSNKQAILRALSRLFERVNQSIEECVAEEFLDSVRQNRWGPEEIAEAMQEYLQQDVRSSAEIYARQRILEEQFSNILLQVRSLAESTKSLPELKNEIRSLRLEYDASINAIGVSVDSIKNSSDVLSSSLTRLDQSTARLATNDSVRAMLTEVESELVSKQDLESKVSALETEIGNASNVAKTQFAIVMASLLLGFLGIMAAIFAAIYPLLQNDEDSRPASTTQTPASVPSPASTNSSK
jgi:hypothetical protein